MNKIKALLISLLSMVFVPLIMGQENNNIKEYIKRETPIELPYISTEINPPNVWAISAKNRHGLPMYVYNDLRGVSKVTEDKCEIYNCFESTNGNYKIFLILLGEYENLRYLLTTYDSSAKLISWLEVDYVFDAYRNFKQSKLNKDMTVEIYNIKVLGENRIDPQKDFEELKAQRIDSYYQIDSLGQFVKVKEIFYKPKIYSVSYFVGKERPIWNGTELVEKEQVY